MDLMERMSGEDRLKVGPSDSNKLTNKMQPFHKIIT